MIRYIEIQPDFLGDNRPVYDMNDNRLVWVTETSGKPKHKKSHGYKVEVDQIIICAPSPVELYLKFHEYCRLLIHTSIESGFNPVRIIVPIQGDPKISIGNTMCFGLLCLAQDIDPDWDGKPESLPIRRYFKPFECVFPNHIDLLASETDVKRLYTVNQVLDT